MNKTVLIAFVSALALATSACGNNKKASPTPAPVATAPVKAAPIPAPTPPKPEANYQLVLTPKSGDQVTVDGTKTLEQMLVKLGLSYEGSFYDQRFRRAEATSYSIRFAWADVEDKSRVATTVTSDAVLRLFVEADLKPASLQEFLARADTSDSSWRPDGKTYVLLGSPTRIDNVDYVVTFGPDRVLRLTRRNTAWNMDKHEFLAHANN